MFVINPSYSTIEYLQSDHISIQYVVQVEHFSTNSLIGIGTLITMNHILTLNTTYTNLELPQDIQMRFRSSSIGLGFIAQPDKIFHHNAANLAIARMAMRVNERFNFAPRNRGQLMVGRFCTIFGFSTRNLVAVAAFPSECGNLFCAPQNILEENFFVGSPVICDGNSIGGLVNNVNETQFVIDDVSKYDEWIEEVVSGSETVKIGSTRFLIFGFILSKLILK